MEKATVKSILYSLCMTLIVMLLYIMKRTLNFDPKLLIYIGFPIIFSTILFCCFKKELKTTHLIYGIILAGILLRVAYTLYTPCNVREYDFGELKIESNGHATYLLYLIVRGTPPDANVGELYQQPLFYFCGTILSLIINGILKCKDWFYLVDTCKLTSLLASIFSLNIIKKLLDDLKVKEEFQLFPLLFISFMPGMVIASGRLTPDTLAFMFMLLAFYYSIKWYNDTSIKNTIILAIIFGLAVLTKLSVAPVVITTAIVFLIKLLSLNKIANKGELVIKYLIFAVISLPIGLWYSIINYFLYGQSLTYVPSPNVNLPIYTGDASVFDRFFNINYNGFFSSPYANTHEDVNFFAYAIKTSLFYVSEDNVPSFICYMLIVFSLIIVIITVIAIVHYIIKTKRDNLILNYALFSCFILLISLIVFYVEHPFSCSVDFRYMMYSVTLPVLFGSYLSSKSKPLNTVLISGILIYSVLSSSYFIILT